LERDRAEQFKAKVTQQAKDAIRRRAYKEAIEILETAKSQSSSGDFDDLLHFCQEEATSYVIRQKIDATADEAHRLMSLGEYGQTIELLEAALKEFDDQELRIILENARRHVQQFSADLQETIATARRLLAVQRFNEAVKFVDSHAARFGKTPEFSQLSEHVHREQRRVMALSSAKEHAREALANSDFKSARAALAKYRQEFEDDVDTQLLQREIESRELDSATATLGRALKDCRVLLQVGCYKAVLDILGRVSSAAAVVPAEMKQDYDFARTSAIAGISRQRSGVERMERMKQQMAHAANEATMSESEWETAGSPSLYDGSLQQTQLANVSELENVLGEVTLVAQHYPGDQKILSAVGSVKQQLTIQIAALRRGDTAQKLAVPNNPVPAPNQPGTTRLDSADKTVIGDMMVGKEETIGQPRPAEKVAAAAETLRVAPSISISANTPASAKTAASSLGDATIIPSQEEATKVRPQEQTRPSPVLGDTTIVPAQEEITNIRSREQTPPAPTRVFKEATKSGRSVPGWLNVPAAVVAAILLVLIIYMVWRAT
jgi:hypothetical protein